jgi:hypothetical protein
MATTTATTATTAATSFATTAVTTLTNNRYYIYLSDDVLPLSIDLWNRLEVPPYNIYQNAFKVCTIDFMKSCQSSYNLWYITLKPFVILGWIIIQNLYKFLLEHGGRSLQKGAIQTKHAMIWLYYFQLSLTRTEILGEIGLIFLCIGLYYFRRWLKQQTYWTRIISYTKEKRKKITKVRTFIFILFILFYSIYVTSLGKKLKHQRFTLLLLIIESNRIESNRIESNRYFLLLIDCTALY